MNESVTMAHALPRSAKNSIDIYVLCYQCTLTTQKTHLKKIQNKGCCPVIIRGRFSAQSGMTNHGFHMHW